MTDCLGCVRMEDEKQCVTLSTGKLVCTHCQSWLIETEARELLKMTLAQRQLALTKREAKRGDVTKLKEAMTRIFNQTKGTT